MAAYGSAISKYYVHYYAQSYRNTESPFNMIDYAQKRIIRRGQVFSSGMSQKEKQLLGETISGLMGRETSQSSIDYTKYYQILENLILKQHSNVLVDRISGQVTALSSSSKLQSEKQRKVALSKNSAEQFLAQFNLLAKNFSSYINKGSLSRGEKIKFTKDQKKLQMLANDILLNFDINEAATISWLKEQQDLSSLTSEISHFFNLLNIKKFKDTQWILLDPNKKSIIDYFNELLDRYKLSFAPASLLQGTHMENIVALAAELAFGKGVEAIDEKIEETLQKSVVGSNKVDATWSFEGVSDIYKERLAHNYGYTFTDENKKVAIKPNYSQGKIDVDYTYQSKESGKANRIKASVKSVQDLSNIHIVGGTSAWNLLNNENPQYIRHYLNILADRTKQLDSIYGKTWKKDSELKNYASLYKAETNAINWIHQQRKKAFLSFNLLAAYKALTGDVLGRESANLFIVNQISGDKSKVYIIEMTDIINMILTELQKDINNINKLFRIEGKATHYENEWVPLNEGGPTRRNFHILEQLHEEKISVIFKGMRNLNKFNLTS